MIVDENARIIGVLRSGTSYQFWRRCGRQPSLIRRQSRFWRPSAGMALLDVLAVEIRTCTRCAGQTGSGTGTIAGDAVAARRCSPSGPAPFSRSPAFRCACGSTRSGVHAPARRASARYNSPARWRSPTSRRCSCCAAFGTGSVNPTPRSSPGRSKPMRRTSVESPGTRVSRNAAAERARPRWLASCSATVASDFA